MAYFQHGAAFAGGVEARGAGGDVPAVGGDVALGTATTAGRLLEANTSLSAIGIVNGKSRHAQQPVAKRFIEAGSKAAVCHMRVAELANAVIEVRNPAIQAGHTATAANAFTGLCQAAARQGFLHMVMAANFEAYGIEEHTATQLPIRDGVPSADAANQCMRIAMKTLQNTTTQLIGEEYGETICTVNIAAKPSTDAFICTAHAEHARQAFADLWHCTTTRGGSAPKRHAQQRPDLVHTA